MSDLATPVGADLAPGRHPAPRERTLASALGPVQIVTVCAPERLRSVTIDPGIGRFARYRSIISGLHTLERVAALPDANVTIALSPAQQIVGYIECTYPDAVEGWRDN